MFTDWVRRRLGAVTGGAGSALARAGVHPDVITVAGLVIVMVAAVFIGRGQMQLAAVILVAGLPLDALDGAVARAMQRTDKFGGILDSTLDRAADALIYAALAYHFAQDGDDVPMILALTALTAGFLVSYVRARAGEAGISVKVGFMDRLVRLVIVLVALFVPPLLVPGLWVLAVGSTVTVLQRLWFVRNS